MLLKPYKLQVVRIWFKALFFISFLGIGSCNQPSSSTKEVSTDPNCACVNETVQLYAKLLDLHDRHEQFYAQGDFKQLMALEESHSSLIAMEQLGNSMDSCSSLFQDSLVKQCLDQNSRYQAIDSSNKVAFELSLFEKTHPRSLE